MKFLRFFREWRELERAIDSDVLTILTPDGHLIDVHKISRRLQATVLTTTPLARRLITKNFPPYSSRAEAHTEVVRLRNAYVQLEGQTQEAIGKLLRGFELVLHYPNWVEKL